MRFTNRFYRSFFLGWKTDGFTNRLLKVWFSNRFENTHHFSPRICISYKSKKFLFSQPFFPPFLGWLGSRIKPQNRKKPRSIRNKTVSIIHRPIFFFFFDSSPLPLELILAGVSLFTPASSSSHHHHSSLTGRTSHSNSPIQYVFLFFTF